MLNDERRAASDEPVLPEDIELWASVRAFCIVDFLDEKGAVRTAQAIPVGVSDGAVQFEGGLLIGSKKLLGLRIVRTDNLPDFD